jgi:tetratricopeptide (TPR) repeat protein
MATTSPDRSTGQDVARRRRFNAAKLVVALISALLLMAFGWKGRQHARVQARLNEILGLREQLQQQLDNEGRSIVSFALVGTETAERSSQSSQESNPQVKSLSATLQTTLGQFQSDYRSRALSEIENLEIRLAKATLANAEQRFAEALTVLIDQDAKGESAGAEAQIVRQVRVLQTRGDSFYGLHQMQEALERYRQMLTLQPNHLVAIARAGDCQYALGKREDAFDTYSKLAKSQNDRGDALLVVGKPSAATSHYQDAIRIQTWLIEQGRRELEAGLARSQDDLGNAFLLLRKPDAAVTAYEKAVEIDTRLLEREGRREWANDLALSYDNLGNACLAHGKAATAAAQYEKAIVLQTKLIKEEGRAELENELAESQINLANCLLGQQKLDAAIAHYDEAIEIQTRLVKQRQAELASELALTHNNRGVVRRAQGRIDMAIADFEKAIAILDPLLDGPGGSQTVPSTGAQGGARPLRVKLDVPIGYSGKALEVLPRTRIVSQGAQRVRAVVLAMSLKNRADADLALGKLNSAIGDFNGAVQIYFRLVEREEQRDLALPFARSLSPVAWIYATSPDMSFRNGPKAKEYARKACELSEWKTFAPIEALAAACAETGDFAQALRWQEKALELAPGDRKSDVRSRLEVYKSGKSYRDPMLKAQ